LDGHQRFALVTGELEAAHGRPHWPLDRSLGHTPAPPRPWRSRRCLYTVDTDRREWGFHAPEPDWPALWRL